jgi:hypothetical protein
MYVGESQEEEESQPTRQQNKRDQDVRSWEHVNSLKQEKNTPVPNHTMARAYSPEVLDTNLLGDKDLG